MNENANNVACGLLSLVVLPVFGHVNDMPGSASDLAPNRVNDEPMLAVDSRSLAQSRQVSDSALRPLGYEPRDAALQSLAAGDALADSKSPTLQLASVDEEIPSPVSPRDLKQIDTGRFQSALNLTTGDGDYPTIVWNAKTPSRDKMLFLQPVPEISAYAESVFCVRPVYRTEDGAYAFFDRDGYYNGSSRTLNPLQWDSPSECRSSKWQMVFEIVVDTRVSEATQPTSVQTDGSALAFTIYQTNSDGAFALENSDIRLMREDQPIASLSGWSTDRGYASAIMTLSPDLFVESAAEIEDKAPELPLSYIVANPDALTQQPSLTVDSDPVEAGQAIMVRSGVPTRLEWPTEYVVPERIDLCATTRCEEILAVVEPTKSFVDVTVFPGHPDAAISVTWREVDQSRDELASPNDDQHLALATELTFQPHVAFGHYEKPLTTCVGRLRGVDGVSSEPFRLIGNGLQLLETENLPASFNDETLVTVEYSERRDGNTCPVDSLVVETGTLGHLRKAAVSGPIVQQFLVNKPLFIGFVSLTDSQTRNSIARWRETLGFVNDLYTTGREEGLWFDGLVLGATSKQGALDSRINPRNNFPLKLADDERIVGLAQDIQYNKDILNGFFEDNVPAIRDVAGDARATLVYFDDVTIGCNEYRATIDKLVDVSSVEKIIVVAAKNNYAGNDALRSLEGGLAHVCDQGESFTVYMFNTRERVLNLDWHKALEAISQDITETGFGG